MEEIQQATEDTANQQGQSDVPNDAETTGADEGQNVAEASNQPSDEAPQAPESYTFTAPEGQEFDGAVIDAFSGVAKELGLSQEAASKILEAVSPVMANRHAELVESQKSEWLNAAKADKEFGGDKLDENMAVAVKALKQFGTPELTELLNQSGLGNHPEIIRAFYRAGKAISEDSIVTSGSGKTVHADPAKRLFPNMN